MFKTRGERRALSCHSASNYAGMGVGGEEPGCSKGSPGRERTQDAIAVGGGREGAAEKGERPAAISPRATIRGWGMPQAGVGSEKASACQDWPAGCSKAPSRTAPSVVTLGSKTIVSVVTWPASARS